MMDLEIILREIPFPEKEREWGCNKKIGEEHYWRFLTPKGQDLFDSLEKEGSYVPETASEKIAYLLKPKPL